MKPKKKFYQKIHPIQNVLLSFIALILTGAVLLYLPFSNRSGISFVDALFTSTSAVCVTGLTVLDTPKDFTFAGQVIILALIQFGGLGIMTFSIGLMALMGGRFSIKWRFTLSSFYSDSMAIPVRSVLKRILIYTVIIESVIALCMFSEFVRTYDVLTAAWHAVFHSISSFCNAGFSTFSDNLVGYRDNTMVVMSSASAIILGGMGFVVLTEIFNAKFRKMRGLFSQFSLHSRLVFTVTLILIFGGMAVILALEWGHLFSDYSLKEKILASFYQSVTCRTAGFNTVDIGALRDSTLFVMTGLMFVGGSPGSIAGGIKTTTLAAIMGLIYARIRGRRQVTFWGQALDSDTIDRGVTLTILALMFICTATFLLLAIDPFDMHHSLMECVFEVTSAFGTVGLSTGITPKLSDAGKLLLSFVMYVGRLGPLTLIAAMTAASKDIAIEYAEEHIMIG